MIVSSSFLVMCGDYCKYYYVVTFSVRYIFWNIHHLLTIWSNEFDLERIWSTTKDLSSGIGTTRYVVRLLSILWTMIQCRNGCHPKLIVVALNRGPRHTKSLCALISPVLPYARALTKIHSYSSPLHIVITERVPSKHIPHETTDAPSSHTSRCLLRHSAKPDIWL